MEVAGRVGGRVDGGKDGEVGVGNWINEWKVSLYQTNL